MEIISRHHQATLSSKEGCSRSILHLSGFSFNSDQIDWSLRVGLFRFLPDSSEALAELIPFSFLGGAGAGMASSLL